MNSPLPLLTSRAAFLALVFTIAPIAVAQRAPGGLTASNASKADAETVTLSPFTVSTDKDVGFVATSSLAGGRLAGNLADTPAAYSVITREFIDALNLTDLNGAIEWTVNTNVNNDNGANLTFASNVTYTTRGVGASTPQRNFFPFRRRWPRQVVRRQCHPAQIRLSQARSWSGKKGKVRRHARRRKLRAGRCRLGAAATGSMPPMRRTSAR